MHGDHHGGVVAICQHCPGVVTLIADRWVHVTHRSRVGWRDRPAFVTCPTGRTVATPRAAA